MGNNIQEIKNRAYDTLHDIRRLSRILGLDSENKSLRTLINTLTRKTKNISLVGLPNVGKSTLINSILNNKIAPESTLPNNIEIAVTAIDSGTPYFLYRNARHELSRLKTILTEVNHDEIEYINVFLDHDWLRQNHILLQEKHSFESLQDSSDLDKIHFFSDTDVVLLLLDGLMPLSKTEVHFLEVCKIFEIPTVVLLSKLDKVSKEEREHLGKYIGEQINKLSKSFIYIDNEKSLGTQELGEPTVHVLNTLISNRKFSEKRERLLNLIHLSAYSKIKNKIEGKIAVIHTKLENIEAETIDKIHKVENLDIEWNKIETKLTELRQGIEQKVRNHLKQNRNNTLTKLQYDLARTNNVKAWWERDLKFILQREIQNTVYSLNEGINNQINDGIYWLQNEIDRLFNYKLTTYPRFEIIVEEKPIDQVNLLLTDNKKLKIFTRVGTVATVIGTGLLITSSPVGAVIAITTLGGIATDWLLEQNNKKDKEKVELELSKIIEHAELNYASKVSANLKETFDKIISNIRSYHEDWKKNCLNEISKQKQLAIDNIKEKEKENWEEMLKEVNDKILVLSNS